MESFKLEDEDSSLERKKPRLLAQEKEKMAVYLSTDLLLSVLQCLSRRQIAKLELTNRRFKALIEWQFAAAPFLSFDAKVEFDAPAQKFRRILSSPETEFTPTMNFTPDSKLNWVSGVSIFHQDNSGREKNRWHHSWPGDETERTLFPFFADIPHIAPFVRFDSVKVDLVNGLEESRWPRANEPHHVFLPLFRAFKRAISGCKLFLRADIEDIDFDFNGNQKDWYGKQFASGQTLLTYLSGQLFPMFGLNGYCRECDVQVRFFTDKSAANHFVDRFFQLPTILHCSHLSFSLDLSWYIQAGETFQLPIKSIVNWLFSGGCHGNCIGKRVLAFSLDLACDLLVSIPNAAELIDALKLAFHSIADEQMQPFEFELSYYIDSLDDLGDVNEVTIQNNRKSAQFSVSTKFTDHIISINCQLKLEKIK